jgi:hypothetical protein
MIYINDILLLHQERLQLARSMAVMLSLLQQQVGLYVFSAWATRCLEHCEYEDCPTIKRDASYGTLVASLDVFGGRHDAAHDKDARLSLFFGKVVATFRVIRGA